MALTAGRVQNMLVVHRETGLVALGPRTLGCEPRTRHNILTLC
jgi:hypothetical protein